MNPNKSKVEKPFGTKKMDLEVVGRHALFFDDDAMAAFVNSSDALVEWNSLRIDRYDVRHLLSGPLPQRLPQSYRRSSHSADPSLESELDHERYLDLPEPSDHLEVEDAEVRGDTSGYHAVSFSYGNASDAADQKNVDGGLEYSGYRPPFPVPESLVQSLPPTEKLHQIIARTAIFVSQHGGQSEIVLRVKQGDNPTFGFLMPDHHLHPYFRFLVDHPELLQSNVEVKTQFNDKRVETTSDSVIGGALTLLGSVYGSGEDEDGAVEGVEDAKAVAYEKTDNATRYRDSHSSEKTLSNSSGDTGKDKIEAVSKLPVSSNKEKAPCLRRNPSIAASKTDHTSGMKKTDDPGSYVASLKKSKDPLVVEPPSDVKKLIVKIVEFILRNGKQFEAALCEQDSKHLRFSFLLPSDQYHPYYLQVLQRAQESKVGPKNPHGNDDSEAGRGPVKQGLSQVRGITSSGPVASDVPYEFDRKEKFKMVIGKLKKDAQDSASKTTQEESGITVDVAAAAAILKAATRGIKNPDLGILSTASMSANSSANPDDNVQKNNHDQGSSILDTVASTSAKTAASPANESVFSEAHLTKEQTLKAERLKRAKMFVARLKDGSVPSANELLRSSSVEPVESGVSGKSSEVDHVVKDKEGSHVSLGPSRPGENAEIIDPVVKAGEGSSAPIDSGVLDGSKMFERKYSVDEHMDRRSKRKYRSRSERNDDDEDGKEETEGSYSNRMRESSLESNDGGVSYEVDGDHKLNKKKHRPSHEHSCGEDHRKEKSHKRHRKKHRSRRCAHKEECGDSGTEASHHKHIHKQHSSRHSSHENEDEEQDRYDKHSKKKHRSHRHSDEEDYGEGSDKRSKNKHSSRRSLCEDGDEEHDRYDRYHKHSKKKHRSHRSSHRSRESRQHTKSDSSRDEESRLISKHDSSFDDCRKHDLRYDEGRKGSHSEKEELEEGEISSKVSERRLGGLVSNEISMENRTENSLAPSQRSQSADIPDDLRAKIRAMLLATR